MYQYVLNGLGAGPSLNRLVRYRMDQGAVRPWGETDRYGRFTGRVFNTLANRQPDGTIIRDKDGKPTFRNEQVRLVDNDAALLSRSDWLRIDERVQWATRNRARFWDAIYGANPLNIPNGMGTIAIQDTVASGEAEATISMDPIRRTRRDRPTKDVRLIPLPFIHSDGFFDAREVAVSANGQLPLDTAGIEMAAVACVEKREKLALGLIDSFSYAGGTVYGATNHPSRLTKTLTAPTGTNGATTVTEVLDMLKKLRDKKFFGPYAAFYSNDWELYFGLDYTTTYPGSLWRRINEITVREGGGQISSWTPLDFLTGFRILIVQLTSDVVQGINGMSFNTVRWQEAGGYEEHFKHLGIQVPRFRENADGFVGLVDGRVP